MGFNTHVIVTGNRISNKIVAVVCRQLKTADDSERESSTRQDYSIWTPSPSFVNLNGFMSSTSSEDMADAKWLSLAMSMPT